MNLSANTPICTLRDLTLTEEVEVEIKALIEEHEFQDAFQEHGVPVRRKILLHGPSGCGKTSLAHAIADEFKIKIALASGSAIMESAGMGQPENNIVKAMQFSGSNRIVLLMDEFDSIAAGRIADADNGAEKASNRFVNTLLTELERTRPLGLFIACTNFHQSIDTALLRRFDLILEIPTVNEDGLKEIARRILKGRFGIRPEDVTRLASTPATVTQKCWDLLRTKIVEVEKKKREETMPLFGEPQNNARKIRERIEGSRTVATQ